MSNVITVVGGGLAGGMLALLLGQKGERVRLIEAREDFRIVDRQDDSLGRAANSIKRSINLALSYRGICALKECGLFDRIQDKLIPMKGRVVHLPPDGEKLSFQPYGVGDQAIFSISRANLNQLLLDEIDKLPNVETLFGDKVILVDKNATITLRNRAGVEYTLPSKFVVGADGAYSSVRRSLQHHVRLDLSMSYITHGYKELTIPPNALGDFAMPMWQGLHIWPRHEFMLIALPNPDKSFTCTLFAPFEGKDGLDSIQTDEQIMDYFQRYFPDVIPICPDLIHDFKTSPSSSLVTVRASPWNYHDKIVILGDAAHACVPFYGQGMNSAFEDCLLFTEIYMSCHGNATEALSRFNTERCPAGHALADLSLENYIEMRSSTASRWYLMKKQLDGALHSIAPSLWIPKYTMVAFTRTPYHLAKKRAQQQDRILKRTLIGLGSVAMIGMISGIGYWWLKNQNNQQSETTIIKSPTTTTIIKSPTTTTIIKSTTPVSEIWNKKWW